MNRLLIVAAAGIVAFLAFMRPHPASAPIAATAAMLPRDVSHRRRHFMPTPFPLVVYVAGAVRSAGLYAFAEGARVNDAVLRARGFASNADRDATNLAERLQDGEEVRVPRIGEILPQTRRSRAPRSRSRRRTFSGTLDINRAGLEQLAQLPGVGTTLAQRIVDYRQLNGRFESVDELADVAGFTQRRVDVLSAYLYVAGVQR